MNFEDIRETYHIIDFCFVFMYQGRVEPRFPWAAVRKVWETAD